MTENRGPSLFDAMVDRQAEATWCLFVLAVLLAAALFVAFGAYDVEATGGAVSDSAEASLRDYEISVRDHEEPYAYLAARAAGIGAAEPTGASRGDYEPHAWAYEEPYAYLAARAAGIGAAEPIVSVLLPFEPYAHLAAKSAGIPAAEPVAGVFLPLDRASAIEPCC
ncbi:hypothetical protein ACFLTC_03290 [Chloroflexota bacterium]